MSVGWKCPICDFHCPWSSTFCSNCLGTWHCWKCNSISNDSTYDCQNCRWECHCGRENTWEVCTGRLENGKKCPLWRCSSCKIINGAVGDVCAECWECWRCTKCYRINGSGPCVCGREMPTQAEEEAKAQIRRSAAVEEARQKKEHEELRKVQQASVGPEGEDPCLTSNGQATMPSAPPPLRLPQAVPSVTPRSPITIVRRSKMPVRLPQASPKRNKLLVPKCFHASSMSGQHDATHSGRSVVKAWGTPR